MEAHTECVQCKSPLSAAKQRRHSKFCNNACASKHDSGKYYKRTKLAMPLPSATVGAIHELVVAIDLMRKGYHVFRALSPACECDLAILHGGKILRIEVTTTYESPRTGKLMIPQGKTKHKHRFDVLALVLHDGRIIYNGHLPAITSPAPLSANPT